MLTPPISHLICGAIFLLPLAGCGGRSASTGDAFARFIPSPEVARHAMTASLTSWRNGGDLTLKPPAFPTIRTVDSKWQAGRRLEEFAILGEVAADRARGFAVRLKLDDTDDEVLERYLVFGIDPLWVFRQEDYEQFAHWEHAMDEPDPSQSTPSAPPEPKASEGETAHSSRTPHAGLRPPSASQ